MALTAGFLGGLATSLGQGLQRQQENAFRVQQLEIQKQQAQENIKRTDAFIKNAEFNQQQSLNELALNRAALSGELLNTSIEQGAEIDSENRQRSLAGLPPIPNQFAGQIQQLQNQISQSLAATPVVIPGTKPLPGDGAGPFKGIDTTLPSAQSNATSPTTVQSSDELSSQPLPDATFDVGAKRRLLDTVSPNTPSLEDGTAVVPSSQAADQLRDQLNEVAPGLAPFMKIMTEKDVVQQRNTLTQQALASAAPRINAQLQGTGVQLEPITVTTGEGDDAVSTTELQFTVQGGGVEVLNAQLQAVVSAIEDPAIEARFKGPLASRALATLGEAVDAELNLREQSTLDKLMGKDAPSDQFVRDPMRPNRLILNMFSKDGGVSGVSMLGMVNVLRARAQDEPSRRFDISEPTEREVVSQFQDASDLELRRVDIALRQFGILPQAQLSKQEIERVRRASTGSFADMSTLSDGLPPKSELSFSQQVQESLKTRVDYLMRVNDMFEQGIDDPEARGRLRRLLDGPLRDMDKRVPGVLPDTDPTLKGMLEELRRKAQMDPQTTSLALDIVEGAGLPPVRN